MHKINLKNPEDPQFTYSNCENGLDKLANWHSAVRRASDETIRKWLEFPTFASDPTTILVEAVKRIWDELIGHQDECREMKSAQEFVNELMSLQCETMNEEMKQFNEGFAYVPPTKRKEMEKK